jgi:hypothetical protein
MIITDCARKDIRSLSKELLLDLNAPATWLDDAVTAYNRIAATAEPDRLVCNPLLTRILSDHCLCFLFHQELVRVPAIQQLVNYYKTLPEFSDRGWSDRRAAVLGDDFAAFHSTLTELSLHVALSAMGLSPRFIDPEPGVRRRADYQITVGDTTLEAEFKSILSEHVRSLKGACFVGITVDPATVRAVWRKFTQPIRSKQIDASQPSVVFVDITACDELFVFLCLSAIPELRGHARSLLDQLATARRSEVPSNVRLAICAFDPQSYASRFIAPLSA